MPKKLRRYRISEHRIVKVTFTVEAAGAEEARDKFLSSAPDLTLEDEEIIDSNSLKIEPI